MGSKEYKELKNNPDKVFLAITAQHQTLLVLLIIGILSTHASGEIYLSQRRAEEWATDKKALDAFKRFTDELAEVEVKIKQMNTDGRLKNINRLVKMPYKLLSPTSTEGLAMSGILNIISI